MRHTSTALAEDPHPPSKSYPFQVEAVAVPPAGITMLSVILPTFNERDAIPHAIAAIDQVLNGLISYEVVVVDDDSPDGTSAVVAELAAKRDNVVLLRRVGKRGLSSAVIDGFAAARGDALLVMDADLQHDEQAIPAMLHRLRDKNLVVGSRYCAGGSTGRWGTGRSLLSRLGVRICRLATGLGVRDLMSGFFVIRRSRYEAMAKQLRPRGFKILVDLLTRMDADEVAEIGYTFRARRHGDSKLTYLVGIELLASLYEIRLGRYIPITFMRYALVGTAGVGVNLLALILCLRFGAGQDAALGGAISLSIAFNYIANHAFTFANAGAPGGHAWRLARYAFLCALGAGINFCVASTIHAHGPALWLSEIVGAAVATMWNYTMSRSMVWPASL